MTADTLLDPSRRRILDNAILALDLVPSGSLSTVLKVLEDGGYLGPDLIKDLNLGKQNENLLLSMASEDPSNRDALLIALKSGLHTRQSILASSEQTELSLTGPIQFEVSGRPTYAVMRDVVEGAKSRLIVTGYSITSEAKEIMLLLGQKAEAGVDISFVMDGEGSGDNMRILSELWISPVKPKVFLLGKRDSGPYMKMHAKMIVADGDDLLVTSANLTWHGMRNNLEIGVRIRGKSALNAQKLVDHMIKTGYLREVAV